MDTDNQEYWSEEDFLRPKLTPEEREAKKEAYREEKREKKRKKPGEIPKYIKGRKEGMAREQQIVDEWNDRFGGKKKERKRYNMKQRLSFELEEEEPDDAKISGIQASPSFSTDVPDIKPKATVTPAPSIAKRRPNSGAMWYAKGDISFEHALMEVKERGTVNGRGEKTISIPKEWLTKQADEAYLEGKEFWYLGFAYKGDKDVYLIEPYDQHMELIHQLRQLQAENEQLRKNQEERENADV